MSRAFTKEDDAGDSILEKPIPSGPNYVTTRGLEELRRKGEELVAQRKERLAQGLDVLRIDRDLRYLESRIQSAIVIHPIASAEIRFGASVTLLTSTDEEKQFQIVGQDEALADSAFLSWSSPLASSMLGLKVGGTFLGPEEPPVTYTISSIQYID